MDITLTELKSMKAKQLRRIIREAIEEVLAEDQAKSKQLKQQSANLDQQSANLKIQAAAEDAKDAKLKADNAKKGISENELDELARIAKGFRLADPNFDASQYANKRVSGTSLSDIINFFRENPGAEKTQLQAQFNFARPQIANAVVNGLLDAGVLVKLGAGGEVEATPEPGEEQPETIDGPEAMFIGGGNPLSQYFDNEPNADGTEDFNNEEEPTVGDVEPGVPASASSMSDEDYEAFMKYSELKDRLNATKSNLLKMKRRKGGVAGDIADKPSNEEQRLRDLKKSLEDRINGLVAGSDYLKRKIEKETGKPVEPIEPEETEEEDTIDEAFDAEYERRKLQFYAGIIK